MLIINQLIKYCLLLKKLKWVINTFAKKILKTIINAFSKRMYVILFVYVLRKRLKRKRKKKLMSKELKVFYKIFIVFFIDFPKLVGLLDENWTSINMNWYFFVCSIILPQTRHQVKIIFFFFSYLIEPFPSFIL